jgi:hypothetical protein
LAVPSSRDKVQTTIHSRFLQLSFSKHPYISPGLQSAYAARAGAQRGTILGTFDKYIVILSLWELDLLIQVTADFWSDSSFCTNYCINEH